MADPAFAGGFAATATVAIPADGAKGSGEALIEGRPAVDVNGDGTLERLAVPSAGKTFAITDATPVAYRQIVDIASATTATRNSRCTATAAPATSGSARPAITRTRRTSIAVSRVPVAKSSLALWMIRRLTLNTWSTRSTQPITRSAVTTTPVTTSASVAYPGKLNNCEGCHLPDTYYPPSSATAIRDDDRRRRLTARLRPATSRSRPPARLAPRATATRRRGSTWN